MNGSTINCVVVGLEHIHRILTVAQIRELIFSWAGTAGVGRDQTRTITGYVFGDSTSPDVVGRKEQVEVKYVVTILGFEEANANDFTLRSCIND